MATRKFIARLARVAVLALVAGVGLSLAWPTAAGAHPLGNFTVNRYARVEVSAGVVRIYYVLDEAEVPAFQDRDAVTADPDGFLVERTAQIADGLALMVDDRPLDLEVVDASLDQPAGEAGLDTLRIAALFEAELPAGGSDTVRLRFEDRNEPERIGWREVVTIARGDTRIESTDVATKDVSDELRSYPDDLLQAPLDVRGATVSVVPGSEAVDALPLPGADRPAVAAGGRFAELVTRQDVGVVAVGSMLGLAALLGAGHALLPGHGKTVMAAYLVGTKGRPIDAVLLGCIVSFMHTASVLVLGLLLFRVNRSVELERLYPVLTIVSGLMAAGLGAWLLRARLNRAASARARREGGHRPVHAPAVAPSPVLAHAHAGGEGHRREVAGEPERPVGDGHDHVPEHGPERARRLDGHHPRHGHHRDGHDHHQDGGGHHDHRHSHDPRHHQGRDGRHSHDYDHDHDSGHDHQDHHRDGHGHGWHRHGGHGHRHELPEDVAPLSRRGLVLLATSGGIVPSPTAVIVVVSAFSLGRAALGLSLVAAFSLGLAATLTAVGLALVFGRRVVERRWSGRAFDRLPVLGAAAMTVLGIGLAIQGLLQLG